MNFRDNNRMRRRSTRYDQRLYQKSPAPTTRDFLILSVATESNSIANETRANALRYIKLETTSCSS